MTKCPSCAQEIADDAAACPHCGRDLAPMPRAASSQPAGASPWAVGFRRGLAAAAALLGIILPVGFSTGYFDSVESVLPPVAFFALIFVPAVTLLNGLWIKSGADKNPARRAAFGVVLFLVVVVGCVLVAYVLKEFVPA